MDSKEIVNEPSDNNEILLKEQGVALDRLIKHSNKTVVDIAEIVGVDRQTIYTWINARAAIPARRLAILAKLFKKHPAEIRYDISMFNPGDMKIIVTMVEKELKERGNTEIEPERKATLICMLYDTMQQHKRVLHDGFSDREFKNTALQMIDYKI